MDDVLNDYTIRDLQIMSSRILADHEATNTFIKQFKADHDSHQFYKNVIKWYVDKYNRFPEPEDKLSFHFTPGDGGLGDRFITVSSILFSITHLKCNAIVYVYSPDGIPCKNFYDTIDFYRFERPQYKIKTIHLDESISYSESRDLNLKDYHYKLYYTSLFIDGCGISNYFSCQNDSTCFYQEEIIDSLTEEYYQFYADKAKHVQIETQKEVLK